MKDLVKIFRSFSFLGTPGAELPKYYFTQNSDWSLFSVHGSHCKDPYLEEWKGSCFVSLYGIC